MAHGFEDLMVAPKSKKHGFEDLMVPINIGQQEIPQQQNWAQRAQNTLPGGFATSIGNQAMDIASLPEQAIRHGAYGVNTALNQIPGVNIPLPNLDYRTLPRAQEPEDPGFGYQAGHFAGEALPWIAPGLMAGKAALKLGNKALGAISPGRTARTLQDMLGKDYADIVKAPSRSLYNQAFKGSKNTNIYGESPIGRNLDIKSLAESMERSELPESGIKYTDLNPNDIKASYPKAALKRLHNLFEKNPTLKNAHKLQSDLAREIRSIDKKGKLASEAEGVHKEGYEYARELLKNDINNFLEKNGSGVGKAYKQATNLHRENVVPYENAADIIGENINNYTGKINPKTLSSSLENAYTGIKNEPLPQDVMKLNELLKKQLRNKKYATRAGVGAGSILGLNKFRHFLGY